VVGYRFAKSEAESNLAGSKNPSDFNAVSIRLRATACRRSGLIQRDA
jgi:hypothetical protein